MAIDEHKLENARQLKKARKAGYGIGLIKGMAVTLKHLFKHNTVIQYPDEKQDLPARTRGVIALKEENCTVCMLCARECPDWCIYIDSHKETLPPKREGGRPRKRNVLDRFAIDYALCMYCGICVEVCPYDALFWSREFEYSEYDIRELTHEKERLSDWMATVLPPPELEVGAEVPGQPAASGAPATAAGAAGPGSAQRPSPPAAATAAAQAPAEQAERAPAAAATAAPPTEAATKSQEQAGETKEAQPAGRAQPTEEKAPTGEGTPAAATTTATPDAQPEAVKSETEAASPEQFDRPEGDKAAATTAPEAKPGTTDEAPAAALSAEDKAKFQESPGPNVEVPHETPQPVALQPTEDAEAVYKQVLQEQLDKGSSPQVAEARAKVARVKAERGIKRGPTPIQTEKMVPSAPTKGQPEPAEPSGAPEATEPKPEQGPVAETSEETTEASAPAEKTPAETPPPAPDEPKAEAAPAAGGDDDPEAVYQRVLAEEKAKGSSEAVAQGRAKAARVKAERAKKNG
ncbi:MAG TPA: 4Fe-4S binding protein [Actinomycetota bacterium]|nr:4Fe-4S binding protein [Actinomycetota bacterium]